MRDLILVIFIAVLITCLASLTFAKTDKVSLNSTGYDWLGYAKEYKRTFAKLVYLALNVDKDKYKPEIIIKMLDDFYYTAIKEAQADPLNVDEDTYLKIRCVDVISNHLNCKTEIMKGQK